MMSSSHRTLTVRGLEGSAEHGPNQPTWLMSHPWVHESALLSDTLKPPCPSVNTRRELGRKSVTPLQGPKRIQPLEAGPIPLYLQSHSSHRSAVKKK